MKKILPIFALLAITVSAIYIISSAKSEAAENVDNLILEIGEVTLESNSKIEEAENAVKALDESDYEDLEELPILEEARATYEHLLDEKSIKEIETAIASIGPVSLEKDAVITSARTLYDQANDAVKNGISNIQTLEDAEKELSDLKVQNVINLIEGIDGITLSSDDQLNPVRLAYSRLSLDEQKQVTNYSKLEAASSKLQEIKEKNAEQAFEQTLSYLKTEVDKVSGITWYKPSTYPYYANSRSYVLPYIGQRDSSTWLRLKFHYTGDNWLFFEKITISIDGENYYKTYSYYDVERDNGSGDVWEWVDISPTTSDIEMLKQIANSKETIVRFQGDNYHYDLTVKSSDKTAINQVLTAYEALKNS